jgi:hypothetical protein
VPLFSSDRERRLWLWTLAVVVAIYSSLGFAPTLAGALRDRGLVSDAVLLGFLLIVAAIVFQGLDARPRGIEIGLALGIAGAYLIAFLRITTPEDRTHLVEYSVVALLVYEALTERARNKRRVPVPALLALAATVLLGSLDEGIQAFLPNRVFDIRDLGFNALAPLMAIAASLVLARARRRRR